jgi:hypothetical protein
LNRRKSLAVPTDNQVRRRHSVAPERNSSTQQSNANDEEIANKKMKDLVKLMRKPARDVQKTYTWDDVTSSSKPPTVGNPAFIRYILSFQSNPAQASHVP